MPLRMEPQDGKEQRMHGLPTFRFLFLSPLRHSDFVSLLPGQNSSFLLVCVCVSVLGGHLRGSRMKQ